MLARSGLEVKESTIGGWFMSISELISPLLEILRQEVLRQDYLQVDESPIPVQDRNKKGALHTGYHWVTHAPVLRAVLFQYHRGRSADFPKKFLKTFSGALQTDGYAGYNSTTEREDITSLACMAHARRKFEQAQDNDKVRATKALESIGALYAIERRCTEDELSTADRKEQREKKALPILREMEEWMKEEILLVVPKSPISKALGYAIGLWPRLAAYTRRGDYLIDNNLVENTIRPMAIGRKNYMFAGSHRGAENAALMYSLLGTCKLNDVEPMAYFTDLIARISEHKADKLSELLPYNWEPLPDSKPALSVAIA